MSTTLKGGTVYADRDKASVPKFRVTGTAIVPIKYEMTVSAGGVEGACLNFADRIAASGGFYGSILWQLRSRAIVTTIVDEHGNKLTVPERFTLDTFVREQIRR